jgi:2-oxoglutarate ferredoxin oxidoreductase subunit delta
MGEPSTSEKPKYWRTPLDLDKLQMPKGKVFLIKERCKGCGFCVEYCPRDVLELSYEFNSKGYHYPVPKNEQACVNCKLCDMLCPEFAIYTVDVEKEKETEVEKVGK